MGYIRRRNEMKKSLVLILVLIVFAPGSVFSHIITFKFGPFIPRAQYEVPRNNLWWLEFDRMSFDKEDYVNLNLGFCFEYFLTKRISLVLSVDRYKRNKSGHYGGYVGYYGTTLGTDDDFAFPDIYGGEFNPRHSFSVSITPIQVSVKLTPIERAISFGSFGQRPKLIPYIGVGIGVYLWNVSLQGEIIDFDNEWTYSDPDTGVDVPIYPILAADAHEKNRRTVGYHAFGGLMFPVTRRMTFELEFKYNLVKGDLKEGFVGFEKFDLSGYQLSVGINYWF